MCEPIVVKNYSFNLTVSQCLITSPVPKSHTYESTVLWQLCIIYYYISRSQEENNEWEVLSPGPFTLISCTATNEKLVGGELGVRLG